MRSVIHEAVVCIDGRWWHRLPAARMCVARPASYWANHHCHRVCEQTYDAAPDLLRLWAALEQCGARLDPMDAQAIVMVRGGGQRFAAIAESFRSGRRSCHPLRAAIAITSMFDRPVAFPLTREGRGKVARASPGKVLFVAGSDAQDMYWYRRGRVGDVMMVILLFSADAWSRTRVCVSTTAPCLL
jgi:hypothetical protein